MARTVVIGSNFAGFTTALELKRKGGKHMEVIVIDISEDFLLIKSLIWVPIGRKEVRDIIIPERRVLEKKGIQFFDAMTEKVDPEKQIVHTSKGDVSYDNLVFATGLEVDFDEASSGVVRWSLLLHRKLPT